MRRNTAYTLLSVFAACPWLTLGFRALLVGDTAHVATYVTAACCTYMAMQTVVGHKCC